MTPGDDDFVWEHTLRGLDRQAAVLGELRQRASIVLSATGITASLLGAAALEDGKPVPWVIAALGVTTLSILACIWVLKPVSDSGYGREWRVTVSASELSDLRDGKVDRGSVLDTLIEARTRNFETIASRTKVFLWSCVLLPVQIGCWSAVLL